MQTTNQYHELGSLFPSMPLSEIKAPDAQANPRPKRVRLKPSPDAARPKKKPKKPRPPKYRKVPIEFYAQFIATVIEPLLHDIYVEKSGLIETVPQFHKAFCAATKSSISLGTFKEWLADANVRVTTQAVVRFSTEPFVVPAPRDEEEEAMVEQLRASRPMQPTLAQAGRARRVGDEVHVPVVPAGVGGIVDVIQLEPEET